MYKRKSDHISIFFALKKQDAHTYKINDSIIRIFSGLSTRFDCKDAFESQINVGPNIIAKFLASIY